MLSLRVACAAFFCTLPAFGQAAGEVSGPGLAIRAAKALTCALEGPQFINDAVLLVRDGRIEAIGPASETQIPEGYAVLDHGDRWIAPGMVDLHCHIAGPELFKGLNDINDAVFLTNPGLRVVPAVIPEHPDLRLSVAGGVTTVLYIPGSASNMGGQGVLLKTGFGKYEDMELRFPGSLKIAQAGNPERWSIGVGRSFMNWNTRATLTRGVAYAERRAASADEPRDPQYDIFPPLVSKEAQISVHTQIYQVVLMTCTMLAGEFGFDAYIDHGSFDGYRAAGIAQEMGVPAILGPREIVRTIAVPGRIVIDTDGKLLGMAAEYQKAGHKTIGFNTDSPIVPEQEFHVQAAVAVRYGFENDEMQALRGLTIMPAVAAGVEDRVGSLEVGKHADVLVVTGDPTDPRTVVERVFIEGRSVYDSAQEKRRW